MHGMENRYSMTRRVRPARASGTFDARLRNDTELTIKMPALRWKGLDLQPGGQRAVADQRLAISRLHPVSVALRLGEDGPSIMKYRDPKQYEEWLKGQPALTMCR